MVSMLFAGEAAIIRAAMKLWNVEMIWQPFQVVVPILNPTSGPPQLNMKHTTASLVMVS